MTRDELLARMSSRELSGWLALYQRRADEDEDDRDRQSEDDGILHKPPRDYELDDDDGI
jgi:hypothetical protein